MSNSFFKAICVSVLLLSFGASVLAKGDDFESVVKLIERYYNVKHQSIPFLAKAGIKTATTLARLKGGTAKRIAEAGSIKLAVFEGESLTSSREFTRTNAIRYARADRFLGIRVFSR